LTGEQPAELISKKQPKADVSSKSILTMGFNDCHGKSRSRVGFETMTQTGIIESAYYESLHELPLIANTVARKKLYEMNRLYLIAEYGCYLFDHACKPLTDFMKTIDTNDWKPFSVTNSIENSVLIIVNKSIRQHPIEEIERLRESMTANEEIG
jgi:ketol-acid reductoisomerase